MQIGQKSPPKPHFDAMLVASRHVANSFVLFAMLCCWTCPAALAGAAWPWTLFNRRGDSTTTTPTPLETNGGERAEWTTADWIREHNYSLEQHQVRTEDGYILQLHRLPRPGHHPVLLVHGLLTSSLGWVLMGPNESLAFLLHNKLYDVWLADTRGSPYVRNHSRLSVGEEAFWRFSFHEVGLYDLPAIIDHIRSETSFQQVLPITHSQAFNAFLVLCSLHSEYNERIPLLQALGPLTELRRALQYQKADIKALSQYTKAKVRAAEFELFPTGSLRTKCLSSGVALANCTKWLTRFAGAGQKNQPPLMDRLVLHRLVQGGSLQELQHLLQMWQSGEFKAFDYGRELNNNIYNSSEPPGYNLSRVSVPIILHFGSTDALATSKGVHRLYARRLHTVKGLYRIEADKFNHLNFFCARNLRSMLNAKLIDIMEKFLDGLLAYVIE